MAERISSGEAARRLLVTPRRAVELARQGQVKAEKVSGVWLFDADSVEKRRATVNKRGGRPVRGEGRHETRFILMNRSHEITEVVYDSHAREFVHLGELADASRAPIGLAPAGSRIALSDFNRWWRNRGIPLTRDGIDEMLSAEGVHVPEELLRRNLGLSLSDQYWIKPSESGLSWSEVNFFNNDFAVVSERTQRYAAETGSSAHPRNTSDGNLAKSWVIRDGVRMLRKGSHRFGQEPYNEVVATALHRRLLAAGEYVEYTLEGEGASAFSLCPDFVSDEEEYVPAIYVQRVLPESPDKNEYQHFLACCEALGARGSKEMLDRMIVCDDVIANHDRHFRNFGVVRNVETLECRFAPLFDSGSSLWCNASTAELMKGERSFASKQFYENPGRQLLLVEDFSWLEASRLDGFADEALSILAGDDAIHDRLPYIRSALEWRLERMVDIAEWS